MKIFKLPILIIFVAFCLSCGKDKAPENDGAVYNLNPQLLLQLINEKRTAGCNCAGKPQQPVPVVKWNTILAEAAYRHSVDMKTHKNLSHTSSDGRSHIDRVKELGYNSNNAGENIAVGYANEKAVIDGWLSSEGHCLNIMNKTYTEVGAGRDGNYWTLVLAQK